MRTLPVLCPARLGIARPAFQSSCRPIALTTDAQRARSSSMKRRNFLASDAPLAYALGRGTSCRVVAHRTHQAAGRGVCLLSTGFHNYGDVFLSIEGRRIRKTCLGWGTIMPRQSPYTIMLNKAERAELLARSRLYTTGGKPPKTMKGAISASAAAWPERGTFRAARLAGAQRLGRRAGLHRPTWRPGRTAW